MKKILLLVHASQKRPNHLNWTGLRDLVQSQIGNDYRIEMSALNRLTFLLHGTVATIYDTDQAFDIKDFDLVVFRTISTQMEQAITVASYCRKHKIPYVDKYISTTGNTKLSCAFIRWEHGLPVSDIVYGPDEELVRLASQDELGWPVILKDNRGKKGCNNYLLNSTEEVKYILSQNSELRFVMQRYVPNDGDYRILVFNDRMRLVILRRSSAGSHLNNTSQGRVAEMLDLSQLPQSTLDLAMQAARLERFTIAGVDIVIHKKTGKAIFSK